MLEPEIPLGKLYTEAEQAIVGRYGIGSIPTMILFRKGREIARRSGKVPRRRRQMTIALVSHPSCLEIQTVAAAFYRRS